MNLGKIYDLELNLSCIWVEMLSILNNIFHLINLYLHMNTVHNIFKSDHLKDFFRKANGY